MAPPPFLEPVIIKTGYIKAEVIDNKWTTLIINKGKQEGIEVNMLVEGAAGFIGVVYYVGKDYSIIKTFWYTQWKLIVIDDQNNYSNLKSYGYFFKVDNIFAHNSRLYVVSEYGSSPFGQVTKIGKICKVHPLENILHIKYVYMKKSFL